MDDKNTRIDALVSQLAELALGHKCLIATAESCTGGLIAGALTEVSGSSAWFDRGFVTYSNEAKRQMLGVGDAVLQEHGAVSEATVLAMAEGALKHSNANVSVSISGVAGPTGGSDEKPVGTVWIASSRFFSYNASTPSSVAEHFLFAGDRKAVRVQAVACAIQLLIQCIESDSR